ncbi:beta-lactamase family [Trichoderma cornu-damae]|uniref:Beta-lactamase family n=1 Tax=Trichoderma cornu-damae TaxID=654480 RepID=A0A9P8TYQ1_9HYPO|nr:beta-lactamase family [Trichoderma cornu-damae]
MDLFNSPGFSSRVEELIKKYHIPGLAIAIAHKDTTASRAHGVASFEPPKAMTADTLFDIASASKSLTAASVALLIADDKYPEVKYEAEMAKLLPGDFVMPGQGYEGVTVDDILSHRSGMAPNDNSYLGPRAKHTDSALSVTRNLRNLATAAPIRSKFMYCNMMFTVATHLVEQKTGIGFADFLEERFFRPLGMTSSNLQPERARAKGLGDRISPGHWWDSRANEYSTFVIPDAPEAQGAGSIITSVNDYVKYVRAMMNKEGPFTEDVYRGLVRARTIIDGDYGELSPFTSPPLYAAGWEVHHYRGYMVVAHDGGIAGSSTVHFFVPHLKFGGAIFGNSDGASRVGEVLMRELIDDLLGLPQDQRLDWDKVLREKHTGEKLEEHGSDDDEDARDEAKEAEEARQKLCPGIKEPQPQKMPLSAYTGEYWNPGWRGLSVQAKDGHLFVDCSDRSYVFTLTLRHVCEQTKYIAHMKEVVGGPSVPLRAEFRFDNDVAVKLGVAFEEELEDYIWFDRCC